MLVSSNETFSSFQQFHSTLTKLGGSTFSLMTFGPTALRGLLHPQAYKICLGLQKYLHRYLDIVKEVCRVYPSAQSPLSLEAMADCIFKRKLVGVGGGGKLQY